MKIYAIRDRLIDYFMQPFVGHSDKEVAASLASTINSTENTHAIAQTPHHFELWRIGDVDEDSGHITAGKELIAGCETFIRATPGRPAAESGKRASEEDTQRNPTLSQRTRVDTSPYDRPPTNAAPATRGAPAEVHPGPGGIPGQLRNS